MSVQEYDYHIVGYLQGCAEPDENVGTEPNRTEPNWPQN